MVAGVVTLMLTELPGGTFAVTLTVCELAAADTGWHRLIDCC